MKKARAKTSRTLRRQWLTGILLQRGQWTVVQVADTLGVSKATCQRDLDLLADLFVVDAVKDPRHSQRSYYHMPVAFKPSLKSAKALKLPRGKRAPRSGKTRRKSA